MTNIQIQTRVVEHLEAVQKAGYNPIYIALQGSQNYGLDYEGSDIDTKAIVLPSFEDIVLNRKPVSTTFILENNEHCDIKDIRLMFGCFKKQNINFLEILFTQYWYCEKYYREAIISMREMAEKIAHYNPYNAAKCMCGMALEKYAAMEKPYPSLMDKIEKFGYDPKQLHHIIRMYEFMSRYLISNESFADCLLTRDRDYLIRVKKGFYRLEEARVLAKEYTEKCKEIKDAFCNATVNAPNEEVEQEMNSLLTHIFKRSFLYDIVPQLKI